MYEKLRGFWLSRSIARLTRGQRCLQGADFSIECAWYVDLHHCSGTTKPIAYRHFRAGVLKLAQQN